MWFLTVAEIQPLSSTFSLDCKAIGGLGVRSLGKRSQCQEYLEFKLVTAPPGSSIAVLCIVFHNVILVLCDK